jgi:hypothetical protein
MKKLLTVILVVVMALSMMSCKGTQGVPGTTGPAGPTGPQGQDFNTPPANATILMSENFESYAVGVTPTNSAGTWQRVSGAMTSYPMSVYNVVTNTAFVSYPKCLMVDGKIVDADREIVKGPFVDTIPNTLSGKIYAHFYVRKDGTGTKGFTIYINQLEKARIDLNTTGAINIYTAKASFYSAAQYAFNIFEKYSFVINLNTNTYDVYFNDLLIAQNITCYNSVECSLAGTPVSPINTVYPTCFGVFTNMNIEYTFGTVYLDNILIYYVPGA